MPTIALLIPEGTEWPLKYRDPESGDLVLRAGFLEAVADASGLALWDDGSGRPILTGEMISALLIEWYRARVADGAPRCPIMDGLIAEATRESLH
jgi:hypothetical protein